MGIIKKLFCEENSKKNGGNDSTKCSYSKALRLNVSFKFVYPDTALPFDDFFKKCKENLETDVVRFYSEFAEIPNCLRNHVDGNLLAMQVGEKKDGSKEVNFFSRNDERLWNNKSNKYPGTTNEYTKVQDVFCLIEVEEE